MQDFRKLAVWERAQLFTVDVYRATERIPPRLAAGLSRQVRDAASSIGANIAEGTNAGTRSQFARYLQIAISSCCEVESHLDLAGRLAVITPPRVAVMIEEVTQLRRMLFALRRKVQDGDSAEPEPAGSA